jgi:hypothetical protein
MITNPPAAIRRRTSKRLLSKSIWLAVAGLFWLTGLARGAETNRPPAGAVVPQSVFVSEGDIGRNPFFPNSRRLRNRQPDNSTKAPVTQDYSQLLVLKGITGPPENRIALINNLTFAKGEEAEVRAGGGKVRVRVLEIRDKSVLINIPGMAGSRELLLQDIQLPLSK